MEGVGDRAAGGGQGGVGGECGGGEQDREPMALLALQINGALFLDYHGTLWYVPGLEPDHWDWRYATPVDVDRCSRPPT
ncbi:hypothetical protein [Micromonospora viridifaciens]|nr:hypothetical protein [Micromonospora viridifaciens]